MCRQSCIDVVKCPDILFRSFHLFSCVESCVASCVVKPIKRLRKEQKVGKIHFLTILKVGKSKKMGVFKVGKFKKSGLFEVGKVD